MQFRTVEQDPIGNRLRGTSLYQNYHTGVRDWSGCRACSLHFGRTRVAVRYDGVRRYQNERPVRVLFIGEAPGATENATGIPFTGVSGRILSELFAYTKTAFRLCITNIVCCQPKDIIEVDFGVIDSPDQKIDGDLEFSNYNREPRKKEITACRPHIDEIVSTFYPEGIVYLGAVARNNYGTKKPTLNLLHPAAIAREEIKLVPVKLEARKLTDFIRELRTSYDN